MKIFGAIPELLQADNWKDLRPAGRHW